MRANESGHIQFANIVKLQDPEVDIRFQPGYGSRIEANHYCLIDRHTSVQDPKMIDPYLKTWMEKEMDWTFIDPPEEICTLIHTKDPRMPIVKKGPNTGVVLKLGKILANEGNPKATKWFESIGVEVVEVDVATLVRPRNSGSIHCTAGSLIRDPEPKGY